MDAQLNKRLGQLSTDELINIVTVDALTFTPDARKIATEILADRGVDLTTLPSPSIMAERPTDRSMFSGMDDPSLRGDARGIGTTGKTILVAVVFFIIYLIIASDADQRKFTGEGFLW